MNRFESDYDQNRQQEGEHHFQTRRSDRYRHPEQEQRNMPHQQSRFERYTSQDEKVYRNKSNFGTYDFRGDEMSGSGNSGSRYGSSPNYGNMGSYGGAQGFGSSRGGYSAPRRHNDDWNHSFDSGRAQQHSNDRSGSGYSGASNFGNSNRGWQNENRHRGKSWQSDDSNRNHDLEGSDVSRRFDSSMQDNYHSSNRNFEQEDSTGYYMGSSNRISRGNVRLQQENDARDRRENEEDDRFKPYGLSGYYSGGYGPQDL
ncbi:hypothetical protein FVR03_21880 [Pontibacter qinzhouensis]|uniref:Uncharacterized protein n=1 Tax=Pontibacter qinzhouensis TaxID=2603253 RepID=A0A5C8IZC7_9BACT|nr:hypothetical protein [Pontibacter qinzhouensis]TXK26414.1 hypothetical protein FVR03_21880 [Pontibacter qinzhouensis]